MRVGRILTKAPSGIDLIDLELLLTKILGTTRAMLKAYPERELSTEEYQQFDELLQRRIKGEPIAYLIGHKEFWSLDFVITPDVLIPRPDTELLVELVLEQMEDRTNLTILDLGTGSGAIALSIANERPDISVVATDFSAEALQVAKLNAKHFQTNNVEFALGSWYEALNSEYYNYFDFIVSNPPYIAQYDPHLAQGDLRFEPNKALMSGLQGMDALRMVISKATKYLKQNGILLVEHGYDQEHLVAEEFKQAGFANITCFKDLSGIPRVTMAEIS